MACFLNITSFDYNNILSFEKDDLFSLHQFILSFEKDDFFSFTNFI
jgi:hypothetical protein